MKNKIHNQTRKLSLFAIPLATIFAFTGCDIEQTEEGELPDIDVTYEEGNLPEYDIDVADVDIGTQTETVMVPKVRVVMEEEEIEVPYIDVDMPDDHSHARMERRQTMISPTVMAPGSGYDLRIQNIYRGDDEIIVVSRLVRSGRVVETRDGVPVRDNVMINAPDMDIRHFVITDLDDLEGEDGDYEFARSKRDFDFDFENNSPIYTAGN